MFRKETTINLEGQLTLCSDVYSLLDCWLEDRHVVYMDNLFEKHDEVEACDKVTKLLSWASLLRDRKLTKPHLKQWLVTALSLSGKCLYYGRVDNYKVYKDRVILNLRAGFRTKIYAKVVNNLTVDRNKTRVYDYYNTRDLYLRGTHHLDSVVDRVHIKGRSLVAISDVTTSKIHDFGYSPVAIRYDVRENLSQENKFYLSFDERQTCFAIKGYEEYKKKWQETSILKLEKHLAQSDAYRWKTTDFLLASPIQNT
jgi:hypothetical protein